MSWWRSAGTRARVLAVLTAMPASVSDARADQDGSAAPVVIARRLPPGHPVFSPSPPPPPRAVPLGINGAILAGVGATFLLLAAVSLAEGASCPRACGFWGETSGKLLVWLGAPAFVVGVPMLAVGVHRHRRWRAWERQQLLELQPWAGGVRGGGSAGVTLRF